MKWCHQFPTSGTCTLSFQLQIGLHRFLTKSCTDVVIVFFWVRPVPVIQFRLHRFFTKSCTNGVILSLRAPPKFLLHNFLTKAVQKLTWFPSHPDSLGQVWKASHILNKYLYNLCHHFPPSHPEFWLHNFLTKSCTKDDMDPYPPL